jgi:hypothetical protein
MAAGREVAVKTKLLESIIRSAMERTAKNHPRHAALSAAVADAMVEIVTVLKAMAVCPESTATDRRLAVGLVESFWRQLLYDERTNTKLNIARGRIRAKKPLKEEEVQASFDRRLANLSDDAADKLFAKMTKANDRWRAKQGNPTESNVSDPLLARLRAQHKQDVKDSTQ